MRHGSLFALVLVVSTSGCALIAGLGDREPADTDGGTGLDATVDGAPTADGATSDAAADATTLDGAADAWSDANDGGTGNPDAPGLDASADSPVDPDATGDGAMPPDAGPDAACVPGEVGVPCGGALCAAGFYGCCYETGECDAGVGACFQKQASCDGPEDCNSAGESCCSQPTADGGFGYSLCATCPTAPNMCHSDCDCPAVGLHVCCPYSDRPNLARCVASCP